MKRNLREGPETSSSIGRQSTDQCWILKNLEDTFSLGRTLLQMLPDLKLLLLKGPLGAGKTSLTKGLAAEMGIKEPITSPTFALAQHYPKGTPPLVHLDLYRLEDNEAAEELFLQEEEEAKTLGAIMVIEWPERLGLVLPDAWTLSLEYLSNGGRHAALHKPINYSRNI